MGKMKELWARLMERKVFQYEKPTPEEPHEKNCPCRSCYEKGNPENPETPILLPPDYPEKAIDYLDEKFPKGNKKRGEAMALLAVAYLEGKEKREK